MVERSFTGQRAGAPRDPRHARRIDEGRTPCDEAGVKLTINGEPREVPDALTVAALLAHLEVPRERVAVERNGEVVKRALHPDTRLEDGDRLEIVAFVGGGR